MISSASIEALLTPFSIFIQPFPSSPRHSDSDQWGFTAHWFEAFGGVNCVILTILPWLDRRGGGAGAKRELEQQKRLMRGRACLVSAVSLRVFLVWRIAVVTHREENTGWLQGWMQCSSLMLSGGGGGCLGKGTSHVTDKPNPITAWNCFWYLWILAILTSVWIVRNSHSWYRTHFPSFMAE